MEIAVYSPLPYTPVESYGLIALELVKQLRRMGVTVNQHGPDQPLPTTGSGGIVVGPVESFASQDPRLCAGPHIAITMFESSRIPPWWVAPLNECAAVIVPSWFCVDAFQQSGVTSPIHVVPLGVGDLYRYQQRPKNRQGLTFLAFMDRGERKGGIVALQAFLRAFGNDESVHLILKSRTPKKGFSFTNPNIEVIQRDMDESELLDLYYGADVLISAHKGEGFGLLPREASRTGCIVLATDWSGTADGLSRWGWPLPYTLVPATWSEHPRYASQDLGVWAKCDPDAIAIVLRDVAANIEHYRDATSEKARAVREMYSWRTFAEQVYAVWLEASKQSAVSDEVSLSVALK